MSYELFDATLPDGGHYSIATLEIAQNGKPRWFHDWFTDKQKAYDFALSLSHNTNKNIYYALGSYDDTKKRTQTACQELKCFFLDIDCGAGKPYENQKVGLAALLALSTKIGMPTPTVVNSGNGLYAYWVFSEAVPTNMWKAHAQVLKDLCIYHGLKMDAAVGANAAQVLRPVGALHRKGEPKPVQLVGNKIQPLVDFETLATILTAAAASAKLMPKAISAPTEVSGLNDEFDVSTPITERPSAYKLAEKCNQLKIIRDTRGNCEQPLWYAGIGILQTTAEAPEIIHEWSKGYAGYSESETDAKIAQASKFHATRCDRFYTVNPSGCVGCPYHSKINSPWQLGLPDPVKISAASDDSGVDDVAELMPYRFSRTDKGILHTDQDNVVTTVYPYDLVPVKLFKEGHEMMHLRHKDPFNGWHDVMVRTSQTHDVKSLLMSLTDQGVLPPAHKEPKDLFIMLIQNYISSLKAKRRKITLMQQMGWVDDSNGRQAFVLGDRFITEQGMDTVGIATGADGVVKSITTCGELPAWSEATRMLDVPGLEPWAFALAALGFGAPLMKMTGYKGAMLSMVGDSGLGKTAMGLWALSVWGQPDKLQMIQRDSHNATVMRMSVYNNLPLFIDEITNIKPEDLSNLAYQLTQGRDKLTLTKDRKEREGMEWATIGATSSNKSLVDVLGGHKANSSAEINRIFEYEFPEGRMFNGKAAYTMFTQNYGVAGEVYAKYLVDNQDKHRAILLKIQEAIEAEAKCLPEERFWAVIAACGIYGAGIAKQLGLFHVDLIRLRKWVIHAIYEMRGVRDDTVISAVDWIGQFLNQHMPNTLVVVATPDANRYTPLLAPRGAVNIRIDQTIGRAYISCKQLAADMNQSSMRRSAVKKELTDRRVLIDTQARVTLGKGTEFATSSEYCWELDLRSPAMGNVSAALVKAVSVLDQHNGAAALGRVR